MPAIVQLHQSDGQAALTRAWGRTAARARWAFIYSSRERTHFGASAKAKWLGFGRIPRHSLGSHVCVQWAAEHNNRQTWFGSQLRLKHTRRPYCGSKQPRAAAFTAGSIVLTDLKHCIQRSRLLESSLNSTVVCVQWHWLQYPPLMNVHCVDKRTWVSVVQRTHVFSINFKSVID